MTLTEYRNALKATIVFLESDYITEECADDPTDGCMSCEMIKARAPIRKALVYLEEEIKQKAIPIPTEVEA